MRLPLHGMGSSLSPFLPHEPSVIPAPLSPRLVFCYPATLHCIRLYDVDAPSTLASPDCGGAHNSGRLEFLDLQSSGVWDHVDERGMSESSVVENLGLQLVRDRLMRVLLSSLIRSSFSDSFFNDVRVCSLVLCQLLTRLSVFTV
jgi:hypothetical protein